MYTTPRKRQNTGNPKTPGKTVAIIKSNPTVSLNTRVHRILRNALELKHYSNDSSAVFPALATSALFYVNPFAGITTGTGISNRIGDQISVEKIVVTLRWYPNYAGANYSGDLSLNWRSSMIKIPDVSLVATTLSTLSLSNYTFSGFVSTGMLNNHDNKVVYDKKRTYTPTPMSTGFGVPAAGTGYKVDCFTAIKTWKNGMRINFKSGGVTQNQDNFIMVLAADIPAYLTAASQGTFYYAYNVFYRDA